MPIPIIGPLISAGLQLGSNLLSNVFGNKAARSQAEEQNELNMKSWYQQQEYNSPKNQMKRYEEAGLNPQLIYGQGTPGNASSPPQREAPQRKAPDLQVLPAITAGYQIQQMQQTIENLKTNQELMKQNIDLKDQQTQLTGKQLDWYDVLSSQRSKMIGSNIDLNKVKEGQGWAMIDKADSEIGLNKQRAAFLGLENVRQESYNQYRNKLIDAQTALANANRLKTAVETTLKKDMLPFNKLLLQTAVDKNFAAIDQMNQGRYTSKASETLMLTDAALKQLQIDGYWSDKALDIIKKLSSIK